MYCMKANSERKLRCRSLESAFITQGFNNWKDATILFRKHEESGCHKDITIPKDTPDVGEMLSHTLAVEKLAKKFRCNLRASIFQNFPGGMPPDPPCRSMLHMLSVLYTLAS